MAVDYKRFFKATDPSKTLLADSAEDKKYYIDFGMALLHQMILSRVLPDRRFFLVVATKRSPYGICKAIAKIL